MKNLAHTLSSSFLAGVCIAVSGLAYLKNPNIIGAVLFSFGLITVVHYKLALYTGTAGFFKNRDDFKRLFVILFGNISGCALSAILMRYSINLEALSDAVVKTRLSSDALTCIIMGIGCGFIMTTAVEFARKEKFLPLLFGVPVFIMCGFYHSIADAFYYAAWISMENSDSLALIALNWALTVAGNFIGCNLYRAVLVKKSAEDTQRESDKSVEIRGHEIKEI